MRKLFALVLLLCSVAAFATSPALTTVTATLQDSSTQLWTNATWSTQFITPFGNPSPPNNNGNPITVNQSGLSNGSAFFTVTLDDNNVVAPAGSKWQFTICPNATVTACATVQLIITGGSMDISAALNATITPPVVNSQPNISRAYKDSEISGAFGSFYSNSVDSTLRQCQLIQCNGTGWTVVTTTTNNPIFTGTLSVPCVKFNTTIPTDDTTVCGQTPVGHINVTLPAISGTLALLNSPVFTGTPTAPTPASLDNSTTIATTAFVKSQSTVLYKNVIPVTHTGTTSLDTVYTVPLPALATNSILRVTVAISVGVQGAGNSIVNVFLATQNMGVLTVGSTGSAGIEGTIANQNNVAVQEGMFHSYLGATIATGLSSATINTGVTQNLFIKVTNANNSDSQTFQYIMVEVL